MKQYRKKNSSDDLSGISTATPIISNSNHSRNSHRILEEDGGSNVTPVISNITPITSARRSSDDLVNPPKKRGSKIDYGQLVVDSRSSFKANNTGGGRRRSGLRGGRNSNAEKGVTSNSNIMSKNAGKSMKRNSSSVGDNSNHSSMVAQTSTDDEGLEQTLSRGPHQSPCWRALLMIWLPLLVTLFGTTRFLLSTTASLTCRFIEVDIGFIPANIKFATSKIQVGPFAYEKGKCLSYPEDFTKTFIRGENSWKAARVSAVMNIVLGFLVFFTAAFVLLYKVLRLRPSSARMTTCIKGFDSKWEIIVLSLVTLTFVFEVVKFAFWGVNLCTDDVWMNDVYNFVPAKNCSLSTGAKCSLSAMGLDLILIGLLTVGSKRLRITLRRMFKCMSCRRKHDPVNTEEDEEMPEPRYFFDGRDNDESEHTAAGARKQITRKSKGTSDKTILPLSEKQKDQAKLQRKGELDNSDEESNVARADISSASQKVQERWVNKEQDDSDEESIIPGDGVSSISQKVQERWVNKEQDDSDEESLIQFTKRSDSRRDIERDSDNISGSESNSDSEGSETSKSSSNSVPMSDSDPSDFEIDGNSKTTKFDNSKPKSPNNDVFSDDAVDLLGFNEPIIGGTQKISHQRGDSDDIGFPSLL